MEQNEQLQEYQERKNKVVEYLSDVCDFLSHYEDKQSVVESINKMAENVEEGLFSIVLVGEFSAGKSTFLNALMHKRILPSFTSETTATVNFLCHKSKAPHGEAGIVYYQDGHKATIPDLSLKTIEKVVSTRGDKGDEKIATTVDRVDLFLDSPFLENGVMLVDSPGLNGIAAHHKEITEQQIKRSHASIFMFSADHPGSKTDFDYLRELKEQSSNNNIFFVLNKINVIKRSEGQTIQSVIDELKKSYSEQFPDETEIPEIWPVAANAALAARNPEDTEYQNGEIVKLDDKERREELEDDSHMEEFEQRLWRYLTKGEKARAEFERPLEQAMHEIKEQHQSLMQQKEALSAEESNADLEKKQEILEAAKKDLEQRRLEQIRPLKIKFNEAFKNVKDKITAECDKIVKNCMEEVENTKNGKDLISYAEDSLKQDVDVKYKRLFNNLDDELRDELLTVVQTECDDYFAAFEDASAKDENVSFKLVPSDWHLTQVNISSNLADYNKRLDEKRQQMEELENKLEQLQIDSIEAKRESERKESLDREIRRLEESRSMMENNFVPPQVEYHMETQEERHDRGGMLGWIAQKFIGQRVETVQKQVADTTARDEAINRHNEERRKFNDNINSLRSQSRQIGSGRNYAAVNVMIESTQNKLQRIQNEFDSINKDAIADMEKNNERAVRKMKRNIRNFLEDRSDEISGLLRKSLEKEKSNYFKSVEDLINTTIDSALDKNSKQLEELKAVIAAGDAERDKKLKQVETDLQTVKELLARGADISTDIENSMKDAIEQEAI